MLIYLLVFGIISCSSSKNGNHCEHSKIVEFRRTAIMDTVTAIVEGKIFYLNDNSSINKATVELTNENYNYKTVSDTAGKFEFMHIAAGTYKVSTSYSELKGDTIHLGTGDKTELKIGICKQ
ncbi:MAG: carboxypeptidase-like regulatory domain-containing protein [Bacteroidota bacterium]